MSNFLLILLLVLTLDLVHAYNKAQEARQAEASAGRGAGLTMAASETRQTVQSRLSSRCLTAFWSSCRSDRSFVMLSVIAQAERRHTRLQPHRLLFAPTIRNYETVLCNVLWYSPAHIDYCDPTFGRALGNSIVIALVATVLDAADRMSWPPTESCGSGSSGAAPCRSQRFSCGWFLASGAAGSRVRAVDVPVLLRKQPALREPGQASS